MDADSVAKNCLLTPKTIIAISNQLLNVNQKVDKLKAIMENNITKSDMKSVTNPAAPELSQNTHIRTSPHMYGNCQG